ncbi:MAG: Immune inhibitor A precursor [Chlorobi bacterium OLB4]|jgi:hypothetical protein|nr:MAG: Immune inhibitor A precursor [Chlorobi bacterium OLB4]MBW7855715.1 immune inhibitor A [Ignavibacteria bacterium]OQY78639.1 MAG: hypothetical protein B6D43_02235 [Ignavibacteriales bacterium UTCHB1]
MFSLYLPYHLKFLIHVILINILLVFFAFSNITKAQWTESDYINELSNNLCATEENPEATYPYFPVIDETLKILVIFAKFPDDTWDPASSYIITQHWPGSSFDEKLTWADSIICPTTTNVWHPSLTGLFQQSSNGKFWLIGDVYPDLVMIDSIEKYSPSNGRNIGYAVKDVLEQIDGNIDWSLYDKFDPYDLNSNNNRREPDGIVDASS